MQTCLDDAKHMWTMLGVVGMASAEEEGWQTLYLQWGP